LLIEVQTPGYGLSKLSDYLIRQEMIDARAVATCKGRLVNFHEIKFLSEELRAFRTKVDTPVLLSVTEGGPDER
jgi:hypothetical protein